MAYAKVALDELKEESDSGKLDIAAPAARSHIQVSSRFASIGLGAVIILAGAVWWFNRSRATVPAKAPTLVRLTSDSGLTTDPALSPAGKQSPMPSAGAAAAIPDV